MRPTSAVMISVLCAACTPSPTDTSDRLDADQDGSPATVDCDDSDPDVFPGADERCNGTDDDCDGEIDEDAVDLTTWPYAGNDDGFGGEHTATACTSPAGFVVASGDCDDDDPSIFPGAPEICLDGVDNDCLPDDGRCELKGAIEGPFQLALTGQRGTRIRLVDIDGDGHVDLLHGVDQTTLRLGPGPEFGPVLWSLPGQVMSVGDLDGDGHVDLVVQSTFGGISVVWGPLAAAAPERTNPLGDAVYVNFSLDVDDDGVHDLVALQPGGAHGVWLGPFAREVEDVPAPDVVLTGTVGVSRPLDDAIGGPGDDLVAYVIDDDTGFAREVVLPVELRGELHVPSVAVRAGATISTLPDVDGDGHDDLCIANPGTVGFFAGPLVAGESPRQLLDTPDGSCMYPGSHDVNGDGVLDLLVPPGSHGGPSVYLGPIDGTDLERTPQLWFKAFAPSGAVAFDDVDQDGFDDWLIPATPADVHQRDGLLIFVDGSGR